MSLFAAIDAQGTTRYIGEVARGAACGCYCAACQSPVVAKQGADHAWHFAHEASQERPQCLPGSINLLRRLATEMLLESGSLVMPECRQVVSTNWRYSVIREVAAWTLPTGCIVQRDMQAAFNKPVAQIKPLGIPDCTIGLWVQIGESPPEAGGEFSGELVYRCQIPPKGAITTHAGAVEFLQQHHVWEWQMAPDVFAELERAHKRLQERIEADKAERIEKLQPHNSLLQPPAPAPLPTWVTLKKRNTSFFAYQMRNEKEFWIVMDAADQPGCYYVVPGSGWWDGWDEALPLSVGKADLQRGAYCGDGPVDRAGQLMRNLGVSASRIDSDARQICGFTGWKD